MVLHQEQIEWPCSGHVVSQSRLHCYMPCIGLNIPCDFVSPDLDKDKKTWSLGDRFEGLIFNNNEIIPRENYINIKERQKNIINLFTIKVFSLFFN